MDKNDVIVVLLIVLITTFIWLIVKLHSEKKQRKQLADENQKLLADNALLEADHLKFQLQPHTLNNILANLKVFASKLNAGMESLSETLDYILYNGNNNLVCIEEEVDFIKKYLKLNDLFITEIDSVQFDTSKINRESTYYKKACIPHLITAHFIENAFKHGDVNHSEFLKLEVILTESTFSFSVVNRIKKKTNNGKEGIGLKNMKKRLELLQTGKHKITQSCNEQEYHSTLLIDFAK
jgi:LytS/YehU family sensor histidine kinase